MVTVDLTSEREGATVQGENLFRFFVVGANLPVSWMVPVSSSVIKCPILMVRVDDDFFH